jgi:hypothetical protein
LDSSHSHVLRNRTERAIYKYTDDREAEKKRTALHDPPCEETQAASESSSHPRLVPAPLHQNPKSFKTQHPHLHHSAASNHAEESTVLYVILCSSSLVLTCSRGQDHIEPQVSTNFSVAVAITAITTTYYVSSTTSSSQTIKNPAEICANLL